LSCGIRPRPLLGLAVPPRDTSPGHLPDWRQTKHMSGCIFRSPVELRKETVRQEARDRDRNAPEQHMLASPFHAPPVPSIRSSHSSSARQTSARNSARSTTSPFAYESKSSLGPRSARARLSQPSSVGTINSESVAKELAELQELFADDPVRPSQVSKALAARFDVSRGNLHKATLLREERMQRSALKADAGREERERVAELRDAVRSGVQRVSEGAIKMRRDSAERAQEIRRQESAWRTTRASKELRRVEVVKQRVIDARALDAQLDVAKAATDAKERALATAAKMERQVAYERARRRQLAQNRKRAETQRSQMTARCRHALSEAEQTKRAVAQATRHDTNEWQREWEEGEAQRVEHAQEVRKSTHASRAAAQQAREEMLHQRQLEHTAAERTAASDIEQIRRSTQDDKRRARDRIFSARYVSAQEVALVVDSPFLNFYLMDDVAAQIIQGANRELLGRLTAVAARTDDHVDADVAGETRVHT